MKSSSRWPLRSSVVGVVGAALAVASMCGVWFRFSGYTLTGVQMDEFLREGFSYNLFAGAVYCCPILAMIGMTFTLIKPYEQLVTRCTNALLLFIATMVASIPLIRILTVQQVTLESLQCYQYGFWLLVWSIVVLLVSWVLSLSEIRLALGKFELVRNRMRRFLREIESEIEISTLAKKCKVGQKLLREALSKYKKNFADFVISENKIVKKSWLRRKLEEKLM